MRRSILSLAAASCLALGASLAHADSVRIDGFLFPTAVAVSVATPVYNGVAGEFTGLLNGNSFVTFCTEIEQSLVFGTTYNDYSVVAGASAGGFGAKSTAIDQLFSYFAAQGYPNNPSTSAVAQAAIWEVLYETGPTFSMTAGSFAATSGDATTNTALGAFNWAAVAATTITVHADRLYSRSAQDLVVLTPVPEPSTYALMLAGLAGIGFVARRRRTQR